MWMKITVKPELESTLPSSFWVNLEVAQTTRLYEDRAFIKASTEIIEVTVPDEVEKIRLYVAANQVPA